VFRVGYDAIQSLVFIHMQARLGALLMSGFIKLFILILSEVRQIGHRFSENPFHLYRSVTRKRLRTTA